MALDHQPTFTAGSTGNIYGSTTGTTLNANTAVTETFNFGNSANASGTGLTGAAAIAGCLQVLDFGGGTVAATNGLQVQVYRSGDGGTTYSTIAYTAFVVGTVTSVTTAGDVDLEPGFYSVKLTNLDVTNAIKVALTLGTWA